jgi:hypothetical protein
MHCILTLPRGDDGYANKVMDWPYSTFKHHVQRGLYPENWGVGDIDIRVGEPG